MKHLSKMWGAVVTTATAIVPSVVLATNSPLENAGTLVNQVGTGANISSSTPLTELVGKIINVALGFLGVVLLGYLLYAGFLWMTSGGDTKKVESAQTMIRNAIIGLIIIVAAFAISSFVLGSLINATA